MKRPSFQFYPADWRKDPALAVRSLAARGLWIDLMCVAHEAAEYGVLSINGKPMTSAQIARTVGASQEEVDALLHELEDAGVFSRNESGAIYSRRMVKDEKLRQVRAECGKLGGNPRLLNNKDKQMDKGMDNQSDNQSPTPSSSSSTSVLPTTSGATAPSASDPIFGFCLDFLKTKGTADKSARGLLGKWRKEHSDAAVIDVVTKAKAADVSEPVAWITATLKARTGTPRSRTDFAAADYGPGGRMS